MKTYRQIDYSVWTWYANRYGELHAYHWHVPFRILAWPTAFLQMLVIRLRRGRRGRVELYTLFRESRHSKWRLKNMRVMRRTK